MQTVWTDLGDCEMPPDALILHDVIHDVIGLKIPPHGSEDKQLMAFDHPAVNCERFWASHGEITCPTSRC